MEDERKTETEAAAPAAADGEDAASISSKSDAVQSVEALDVEAKGCLKRCVLTWAPIFDRSCYISGDIGVLPGARVGC